MLSAAHPLLEVPKKFKHNMPALLVFRSEDLAIHSPPLCYVLHCPAVHPWIGRRREPVPEIPEGFPRFSSDGLSSSRLRFPDSTSDVHPSSPPPPCPQGRPAGARQRGRGCRNCGRGRHASLSSIAAPSRTGSQLTRQGCPRRRRRQRRCPQWPRRRVNVGCCCCRWCWILLLETVCLLLCSEMTMTR